MDYSEVLRSNGAQEFRLPKSAGEDNWKSRMDFCNKMTATIDTYGNSHLPKDFTAQIEPYLNNLLDCARSERTQLSISACKLLGALPKVLERDMHPHLDRMLPDLIKLCANTKQVAVKVAAAAVASIIQYSTYNHRLLWHVCQVFEDKVPGPKQHGTVWLQTLLKEYHRYIDLHKESRMICRALHLALEDADATVRTNIRATYWTYSKLDSDGAAEIMEKLDQHKKTALQNDPHNPDKKNVLTKKQPPRPMSALAEVRKEQAKKKRAEEEASAAQKQQKALSASTASHDSIEIHEPRKDKLKKEERGFRPELDRAGAGTALFDRTSKDIPHVQQKREANVHKKALSQDDEVVTKPSVSSRLLSAPVRRPRINVTPMTGSHTAPARPSSRTGHAAPSHTHGQQAAPSSSISRAGHAAQPKETQRDSRPTSSSSSKSGPVASSEASTTVMEYRRPMHSPKSKTPSTTSTLTKSNIMPETKQHKQAGTASSTPSALPKASQPYVPDGKENTAVPRFDPKQSGSLESTEIPRANRQISPEGGERYQLTLGQNDRNSARRFLNRLPPSITSDLLTCRKLKGILEQFPDIVPDEATFDRIFSNLSESLATKFDLIPSKSYASYPYGRQLILQTTIPLIQQYGNWSHKYRSDWIRTMIFYRCTLPQDPKDRRTELCMRNISTVISGCPNPLDFIPSVVSAIDTGEDIILRAIRKGEEDENPDLGVDAMGGYLKDAINENQPKHKIITTPHEEYPQELDHLYETALSTLAIILEKGKERNKQLTAQEEEELCELAKHALATYTYTVKRSVISFVEHLQLIVDDDQRLLSHFTEESQVNLLEYYMSETRRKYDIFS
ncbi:suppressor of tub2 mutation [Exophiala xenobiotica]|uniref:Suppressor of tub2 mutation n=1 Tax=Lithohypha guttulata TaxID=1690604 RepID=A0ABR0KR02_9EURO|nr:suppressor of tub2 mutation [Lithohypha guttulata]KAK5330750.1 suppressor of tub2 mutation [Exophiala xenobiotica]